MKNHQFSSKLLFVFFGIVCFGCIVISQSEDNAPILPFFATCILLFLLPGLYMQMRAKQIKGKLDEAERSRKIEEMQWFEYQQRMQWAAEQQRQQNAGPYQYMQNGGATATE